MGPNSAGFIFGCHQKQKLEFRDWRSIFSWPQEFWQSITQLRKWKQSIYRLFKAAKESCWPLLGAEHGGETRLCLNKPKGTCEPDWHLPCMCSWIFQGSSQLESCLHLQTQRKWESQICKTDRHRQTDVSGDWWLFTWNGATDTDGFHTNNVAV